MNATRILVVEDNPINTKLMEFLLTLEGHSVACAETAAKAEEIIPTFNPQVILMDIQLPFVDGLDFTKQLRTNPLYKDIIIIAVTAYAMKGDKEKALKAGCNGYITKPIDTENFTKVIAGFLEKHKTT